jgi:1-aminocyclopropane-1-carboxylate deaminase
MIQFSDIKSEVQFIQKFKNIELSVLREDEIHPSISGNKFRKLKYNLEAFSKGNFDSILTFGGAYSNHIYAVAAAGKEFGIQTIGIIRGEELSEKPDSNPTLSFAKNCGMKLEFISRNEYRNKENQDFLEELKKEFGDFYLLPEGGTNALAVKGCEGILGSHTSEFDFICCAVGTGGTISGLINSAENYQKIIGFPALKNAGFLKNEIKKYSNRSNWELIYDFHFGGYAKVNNELLDFINGFKKQFDVNLEPVYTGKMMFGILKLIRQNYFPENSKILAVHTGGLQGMEGINQRLNKKTKAF